MNGRELAFSEDARIARQVVANGKGSGRLLDRDLRLLNRARRIGDRVAVILLQQRIRAELAR